MLWVFAIELIHVKCARQQGLEMKALYLQSKCSPMCVCAQAKTVV